MTLLQHDLLSHLGQCAHYRLKGIRQHPGEGGPAMQAGVAKAMLQQRRAVQDDVGAAERTHPPIAQTWPLEDGSKFDDTKAAIWTLREACNCLHQRAHLMEKAAGGKADSDRVQELTGTMSLVIDQIRQLHGQLMEVSKRADLMSDNTSERIADN